MDYFWTSRAGWLSIIYYIYIHAIEPDAIKTQITGVAFLEPP